MTKRCATRKLYPTNLPALNVELTPLHVQMPDGTWRVLRLTSAPANEGPLRSIHPDELEGTVEFDVETPFGEVKGMLDCDNYLGNGKHAHGSWWDNAKTQGAAAMSSALYLDLLTSERSLGGWCDTVEDILNLRWIETPADRFHVTRTHLSPTSAQTFGYQVPLVEENVDGCWDGDNGTALFELLDADVRTMVQLFWELCGTSWTSNELEDHITAALACFGISEDSDQYWRSFFHLSFALHPDARVRAVAAAQRSEWWWHTDPSPSVRAAAAVDARTNMFDAAIHDPNVEVRAAVAARADLEEWQLTELATRPVDVAHTLAEHTQVCVALAQRHPLSAKLAEQLAEHEDALVRITLAANYWCPTRVLRQLATDHDPFVRDEAEEQLAELE